MPSIANSNATTKQEIRDVCSQTIFANFAANATTPTVANGGTFKTLNTVATVLSDFLNGFDGQRIVVVINDANTTVDFSASNLIGNGGVDWSPNSGDSFTAVRDSSGNWFCQLSGGGGGGSGSYILKDADDTSTGKLSISGSTDSTYQLAGLNSSTANGSIGITGSSVSANGIGVYATSLGSGGRGFQGEVASSGGRGISLNISDTTGVSYGSHITIHSTLGTGGYFENTNGTGTILEVVKGSDLLIGTVNATEVFKVDSTGAVEAAGGINRLTTSTGYVDVGTGAAPAVLSGNVLIAITAEYATWAKLGHTQLTDIGTNTHDQIDTAITASANHIADGTLHYTVASIDHTLITNIGTNSHTDIDTHIADNTIHFLQSEISITTSQLSDLGLSYNNGVAFATMPLATPDNAIALGDAAEAADISSIAMGTASYASGEGSIAFGWNAIAQATDTIGANTAIGTDAYALGSSGATALGYGATAEEKNTIAIGNVVTKNENDIKLGFDGVNELYLDASGALIINNDTAMYKLPTYTVVTVPTVSTAGAIYVSDGAAGLPVMAFSNGTDWLRCDNLTAIAVV